MGIDSGTNMPSAATPIATLSAAQLAVAVRRARNESSNSLALLMSDPIAIVGIGCRFPGGVSAPIRNAEEYREFLAAGRSGIREIPTGRWEEARQALEPYQLLGGYLDGVDLFDAEFFGIAPKEAHSIDPQQRLLLEVCWEALSDAAITPGSLSGSDTGVFAAIYSSDYARLQLHEDAVFDSHTGVGAAHSIAAGRLSFLLNLRGPSMAVDTACSSSLVATHLACQSLRKQECSVAIVAGCSLKLLPDEVRAFAQWGMLAHDGRAKTFDASADGFVPGEGCAVLVLKRLSDAVAQGDAIHAVIRGTAVNHDGRSSVLTAPNGPAQEDVMRAALRDAQVSAQDITFVETHGTGTSLGDPIEVEALDAVYGPGKEACVLGAAKTNFGHLEAAAGLAGLMKCVVALESQRIPVNLNFTECNPQIRIDAGSRLEFANASRDWRRGARPRFAAVSSFGLGGTNAHIILEESPLLPQRSSQSPLTAQSTLEYCVPISAHTASALRTIALEYVDLLRAPEMHLDPLSRAAARGRDHGDFRIAVSGSSAEAIAQKLEERIAGMNLDQMQKRLESAEDQGKHAFVFSGQGSLWPGVLENLLQDFPETEKTFSLFERIVQEAAGWSLRAAADDAKQLEDTAKAQPVLFAVQILLTEVLRSRGIAADAVAGHSVGEIAAAVIAGVLSLEHGMRLVLQRGRHMGTAMPGQMLTAELSKEEAETVLSFFKSNHSDSIDLAAINGPRSIVFAGTESAIEDLERALRNRQVTVRRLEIAYAFHSASMDSAAKALNDDLLSAGSFFENRVPQAPTIPIISTVTGKAWAPTDGDAAYWSRGIREQVRFCESVKELIALGCRTVIEIGPHPALLRSVAAIAEDAGIHGGFTTVASMRRGQLARATILSALASLYEQGAKVDWKRVYPGQIQRIKLPAFPWERRQYWLAAKRPKQEMREVVLSGFLPLKSGDMLVSASLLGASVSSPFLDGRLWEANLSTDTMPWLSEHCWQGHPILPFAAWLEIARQAAVLASEAETETVVLREFGVSRRLEIDRFPTRLQTFANASHELKLSAKSTGDWESFASGYWDVADINPPDVTLDLKSIQSGVTHTEPVDVLYDSLEQAGLTYGRCFRLLRSMSAGPGFVLAEVDGSQPWLEVESGLHPCVLDACLQSLQALQPEGERGATLLPVSVKSYQWMRKAQVAYVVAKLSAGNSTPAGSDAVSDLTIFSQDGSALAVIGGLRVRRVVANRPLGGKPAAMWQVQWQVSAARETAVNDRLLQSKEMLSGDFRSVSARLRTLVQKERLSPGSIHQLTLMTRGAFAVFDGESTDPEQRALVGLVRSLRAEYPAIVMRVLDLPLDGELHQGQSSELTEWIDNSSLKSTESAYRQGRFLSLRLQPFESPSQVLLDSELKIGTPGILDTLLEDPCQTGEPASDEIQIACRAHGLNFRDVLTAMGAYAGMVSSFGAECSGVVTIAGQDGAFKTGDAVLAFAPRSMRSLVNVKACFAVRKPARMTFAEAATIPVAFLTAHFGFSQLAKITRGQTVLIHSAAGGLGMAAVQLARLAGATILATAGTEEKRQLLRKQGIEHVFDSHSEQFAEDVLRVTSGLGVDVVLNALSGDKIEASFRALKLGGAFLEVGKRDIWSEERVSSERPDVRYWAFDLGEVASQEPGLIGSMLGEIMRFFDQGSLTLLPLEIYPIGDSEHAFRKMAGGRHIGKLALTRAERPISSEVWSHAITRGVVLISGGTGALGVATARWLLQQGAHRIVLLSRSGRSEAATRLREEFEEHVVLEKADITNSNQVSVLLARIRSHADVPLTVVIHMAGEVDDRLLTDQTEEKLQKSMHTKVAGAQVLAKLTSADPLFMTIYFSSAAGILGSAGQSGYAAANAELDALAEQRCALGMRTLSVDWGAWDSSDFGRGMFGQLTEASSSRALRQGIQPMLPERALAALQKAIHSGQSSVMIADLDWHVYRNQFPSGTAVGGFFEEMLPELPRDQFAADSGTSSGTVKIGPDIAEIADIRSSARADRLPRMESFVRSSARKVLGLSASRPIPGETPLQELGLDSLMALELRNLLAHALQRPLSATLLFDYPTIRGLASYLLPLVVSDAGVAGGNGAEQEHQDSHSSLAFSEDADLEAMTDAEAEELLLAELNQGARL